MNRGIKVLQTLALPLGYGTASLNRACLLCKRKVAFVKCRYIIYNISMHGILTIIKWEISRVFSNWQRAAAVFIVPAAVMMVALNIFPYLINYMSTGSLTEKPIIVAGAPDSFIGYLEQTEGTTIYKYEFITEEELAEDWDSGKAMRELRNGRIYTVFVPDDNVAYIGCNGNSQLALNKAESYIEVVMDPYNDYLSTEGNEVFEVNAFNPVIKLLDYRTEANYGSARVIPAILVLLIYYCVYSMMSDMFASERDRGFFDKLLMTPVSPQNIVFGKMIACTLLVSGATLITMLFLFLSSWLNRSNSSTSLIPFGLMLFPEQLLVIVIVIPVTAFLCSAICLSIIFSIRRMKDVILNLQMPLIYLLADLFFQIFSGNPGALEFFIPIHGSIAIIKAVFMSNYRPWQLVGLLLTTLTSTLLIIRSTFRKAGFVYDKSTRRT